MYTWLVWCQVGVERRRQRDRKTERQTEKGELRWKMRHICCEMETRWGGRRERWPFPQTEFCIENKIVYVKNSSETDFLIEQLIPLLQQFVRGWILHRGSAPVSIKHCQYFGRCWGSTHLRQSHTERCRNWQWVAAIAVALLALPWRSIVLSMYGAFGHTLLKCFCWWTR